MPKYNLVVTIPFGSYVTGQIITDDAEVDKALASNARHVVKITRVDPAPDPVVKPVDPVAGGTPAQASAVNQLTPNDTITTSTAASK